MADTRSCVASVAISSSFSGEEAATLPELLSSIRHGPSVVGERAATEMVRRFQPLVRRYWRAKGCGDLDDFSQEVWTRLFESLPQLRDADAFPGFMRRIVVACAADYWRKRSREVPLEAGVDIDALYAAFDAEVAVPVVLRAYLHAVPPQERRVLERVFVDGWTPARVAAELGITPGAVRKSISRGINRLRAHLLP